MNKVLSHLEVLESEAIFILREVAAEFSKPALLFSGGKDSIILVHLAIKAFYPARVPFDLLHIDTGHNFPETILFRDKLVAKNQLQLQIASVQEAIDTNLVEEESGFDASRNNLQTKVLIKAIKDLQIDAAIGGARRDEEKARAKERIFSHRDEAGRWNPKNQRPELWKLFNARKKDGEHFRVFPISNWTETDVWEYILKEKIEVPSLYFTHQRPIIKRESTLLADSPFLNKRSTEITESMNVRCRTIGDMTCTGLVQSEAQSIEEIIEEITVSKFTERGGRFDDKRSETSMEDRKKEGYF